VDNGEAGRLCPGTNSQTLAEVDSSEVIGNSKVFAYYKSVSGESFPFADHSRMERQIQSSRVLKCLI
jgi:hypothetical protein